ncbi:YjbH domain-containing protein [Roseivivax sediminis]|uniref:Exopolysaccharide biosynthesis protein YbjH n=1 Tax=Roseivivax sediminis TaxID=936889 RepID=A0A1I2CWA2_9RHOB|nr:YjbH domain-containing protein [Roseivivax sediminis]SFE72568.1 Exopolysaccharide biosynthesis protein YbjH [Roseivivax sediminis]
MKRTTGCVGLRHALLCGSVYLCWASSAVSQSSDEGSVWKRPILSFQGVPGIVDMPTAHQMPDANGTLSVNSTDVTQRNVFHFQISPRLSGVFRYSYIEGYGSGDGAYYDRSFDLRYQLADETARRPAVTVGLQDFGGTGIYGGEYLVASKTFGRVRATGGLGWGRLGTQGGFGNPLGFLSEAFDSRPDDSGEGIAQTGKFDADQWFRGEAALFGGIQFQATDRLVLSAEYSSDAYDPETARTDLDHQSPFNVAATYRVGGLDLTAAWLYGTTAGLQLSYTFDATDPLGPDNGRAGQGPVVPAASTAALGWDLPSGTGLIGAQGSLSEKAQAAFSAEGLALLSLDRDGDRVVVHYRNDRYLAEAEGLGRAARTLAAVLPAEVARITLVPRQGEIAPTAVTFARSDLADLQGDLEGGWNSLARARLEEGSVYPLDVRSGGYPRLTFGLSPYVGPTWSDPDNFIAESGLRATARMALLPGLTVETELRQPAFVRRVEPVPNLSDGSGTWPVVRTDAARYDDDTDLELRRLTADYHFRPGPELFGRISAGMFEQMYGGVSGELLWKPAGGRWGFGTELTWAAKRAPGEVFGFEDYTTTTGFASAYYELGDDYLLQLDVGRYLAGDIGGTLSLDREFANGFSVGAYATITEMSTDAFGEGSFDKGIRFSVPASWLFGTPSRSVYSTTWRPVTGDGGARVEQAARLYDRVRNMQPRELQEDWGRFWR